MLQKTQISKFQESRRRREDPTLLHITEANIKIHQSQLDTLSAKVHDFQEQCIENQRMVTQLNAKITQFVKEWEDIRLALFATNLRSVLSAYVEVSHDELVIFQDVLNYNFYLQN